MLVRDTQLDNQQGRKLEARWRGLRILVQTTKENLSGWTKTLYSDEKLKRYHMQDLKKYIVQLQAGKKEEIQIYEPLNNNNQDDSKLMNETVIAALPFYGTTPTVQTE